jgi:hypothetical protein
MEPRKSVRPRDPTRIPDRGGPAPRPAKPAASVSGTMSARPPTGSAIPPPLRPPVPTPSSAAGTGAGSSGPQPGGTTSPPWLLLSLLVSLGGFLGILFLVYHLKFDGSGYSIGRFPARDLFVGFLTLACAPFVLTLFQRVPAVLLAPAVVLVFMLYPLFSPFGLPYSRDPIFNFQFAQVLLTSAHWTPLAGVTEQAGVYSYFPPSAIFNAEGSLFLGVPLSTSFLYTLPALRLLVLPATIYALGLRLFGPRPGALGVLLYMGVPSITFNLVVQQEFAIIFLALSFLALTYVEHGFGGNVMGIRVVLVLFSSFIVLSHHLTTYIAALWLVGLVLVPIVLVGRTSFSKARIGRVLARYLIVFVLYTAFVTASVVSGQVLLLSQVISALVKGVRPTGHVAALGLSFPFYQQAWIGLALGLTALLGLAVLRKIVRIPEQRFLSFNLLISLVLVVAAVPLLPTSLNFLVLRAMEYAGIFLAPTVAAWFVVSGLPRLKAEFARARTRAGFAGWIARHQPRLGGWLLNPDPPARRRRTFDRLYERTPHLIVVAGVVFLFAAGSLVPLTTRDQFASSDSLASESPLFITPHDYDLALWAGSHLNRSSPLWGDYLAYDVFGGFGRFSMPYGEYPLFNGTNITTESWSRLPVGAYVVTDAYMTRYTPEFPGPGSEQPTAPLLPAQLTKFDQPALFSVVYVDPVFTIFEVVHKPA